MVADYFSKGATAHQWTCGVCGKIQIEARSFRFGMEPLLASFPEGWRVLYLSGGTPWMCVCPEHRVVTTVDGKVV